MSISFRTKRIGSLCRLKMSAIPLSFQFLETVADPVNKHHLVLLSFKNVFDLKDLGYVNKPTLQVSNHRLRGNLFTVYRASVVASVAPTANKLVERVGVREGLWPSDM